MFNIVRRRQKGGGGGGCWCFLWSSLNKRLSKQSTYRWYLRRPLWRHCNLMYRYLSRGKYLIYVQNKNISHQRSNEIKNNWNYKKTLIFSGNALEILQSSTAIDMYLHGAPTKDPTKKLCSRPSSDVRPAVTKRLIYPVAWLYHL